MESCDSTPNILNLHSTVAEKRYIDLDDSDGSDHASKRACLQPQHRLAGVSPSSVGLRASTIDSRFKIDFLIETVESVHTPRFED